MTPTEQANQIIAFLSEFDLTPGEKARSNRSCKKEIRSDEARRRMKQTL